MKFASLKALRSSQGFTLVELVIVIAILGILTAVALPRFADFTTQSKAAARSGVVASLNSAYAIAHGKAIADGAAGTVSLDGGVTININAQGYPDVAGYAAAGTCQTLLNNLLSGSASQNLYASQNAGVCQVTPQTGSWSSPITLTSTSAS